uniref:Saposin B-type domain-containing protein n=1 Tax=Caenorhabditis tropicalis TaxID=1561998 RepID=A0A1I7TQA0_9PELO
MLFVFFLLIASVACHVVPADPQKSIAISDDIQCAVCQFLAVSVAAKSGSHRNIAHCLRFNGCEKELEECEIVSILHDEIQKTPEKFVSSREAVAAAHSKCTSNSMALAISEDASATQCMLCFLVYDTLKYINYNILENPMLLTVQNAIEAACAFLNEQLCQALFEPHAFEAIIRGLQDSLGGFYDLIAMQGFGCVDYTKLFGECPGH